jgi:hypothetical protein
VTTGRETAAQDLVALDQVISEFRAALDAYQEIFHITLDILESGGEVAAALEDVGDAEARPLLSDTLLAFEKTRHRWRPSLVAAANVEGMSIGTLAHVLCISRQLSGRCIKVARGGT